ncbi:MAG: methylenetetrahydrofolate reductase, partial [bacterium]|nr:methylenetetrahydrofolate reductase [bacterium]
KATLEIAKLIPDYVSVTYGAGGSNNKNTISIAKNILQSYNVTTVSHLTCVASTKQQISERLVDFRTNGIENILALRGDVPPGFEYDSSAWPFKYACELIEYIKENSDFCVGGACYPEGHVESKNRVFDTIQLKNKVDSGCDYLVTQMFFDNNIFYDFYERTQIVGIDVPIVVGIMPVTNGKQIDRICRLSGTVLPKRFVRIVEKFGHDPAAMKQAGVAYAAEQIIDLVANGVGHVHVYSMNKPDVAAGIKENLSEIFR